MKTTNRKKISLLKALVYAVREHEMLGSKDPNEHREIKENLANTYVEVLVELTGCPYPNQRQLHRIWKELDCL